MASLTVLVLVAASTMAVIPLSTRAQTSPKSLNKLRWTTQCAYQYSDNADPIVMPDGVDSMHRHDFFGARVTRNSNYARLRAANNDGCVHFLDDESGYWVPTLYDRGGNQVAYQAMSAYYLVGFDANPVKLSRWPRGLEVIAGNLAATGPQFIPGSDRQLVIWTCAPITAGGGEEALRTDLPRDCLDPAHPRVRARIYFPDCSNGAPRDEVDHRSHMAYSVGGVCPSTHPRQVPMLQLNLTYNLQFGEGAYLSSSMADPPTAYGMHADWMDGWSPAKVTALIRDCLQDGSGCFFTDPSPPAT